MINNFPFFRGPFNYPRNYSNNIPYNLNYNPNFPYGRNILDDSTKNNSEKSSNERNISSIEEKDNPEKDSIKKENNNDKRSKEKSSKYTSFGPIFINTDGFFNKEEPLLNLSSLKIYLDDLIILSLLYILYKEDVKDDILFISLILLLIS